VSAGTVNVIELPPADSGKGLLRVSATPWGAVLVNGRRLGDTPLEAELPAGRYRVRVEKPPFREDRIVTVRPGLREICNVQLRAR